MDELEKSIVIKQEMYTNELGIVIAAGGSSSRFGTGNKLSQDLDGVPVFIRSIINFIGICPDENLFLVVPECDTEQFLSIMQKHLPRKNIGVVPGGKTRMDSVFKGLKALPTDIKYVAVCDAARPLASAKLLLQCLNSCRDGNAGAVAAKPLTDTIKESDSNGFISCNRDRSSLWRVETPQVFHFQTLVDAYEKSFAEGVSFTDDAGVMGHAGHKVFLLDNPNCNIKITFQEDILTAESALKEVKNRQV